MILHTQNANQARRSHRNCIIRKMVIVVGGMGKDGSPTLKSVRSSPAENRGAEQAGVRKLRTSRSAIRETGRSAERAARMLALSGAWKMNSIAGGSALSDPGFVSLSLSHDLVQRIVNSKTFQSAPTLQQLFRFLATRALEEHTDEIKEYTIGVEALGRKPDFDPKTDPIVRVQVYRLRQKLKEYFELEGSQDSILVEIPKGHYLPKFELLKPLASNLHPVPVPEPRIGPEGVETVGTEKPHAGVSQRAAIMVILFALAGFA